MRVALAAVGPLAGRFCSGCNYLKIFRAGFALFGVDTHHRIVAQPSWPMCMTDRVRVPAATSSSLCSWRLPLHLIKREGAQRAPEPENFHFFLRVSSSFLPLSWTIESENLLCHPIREVFLWWYLICLTIIMHCCIYFNFYIVYYLFLKKIN